MKEREEREEREGKGVSNRQKGEKGKREKDGSLGRERGFQKEELQSRAKKEKDGRERGRVHALSLGAVAAERHHEALIGTCHSERAACDIRTKLRHDGEIGGGY